MQMNVNMYIYIYILYSLILYLSFLSLFLSISLPLSLSFEICLPIKAFFYSLLFAKKFRVLLRPPLAPFDHYIPLAPPPPTQNHLFVCKVSFAGKNVLTFGRVVVKREKGPSSKVTRRKEGH